MQTGCMREVTVECSCVCCKRSVVLIKSFGCAQLVKSLSREDAEELHIPSDALSRFRYLNLSGCTSIPGTDDVADFHLVQHAMDAVNIEKKAQVLP